MALDRIDLTQFEGIGKWEVEKQPDGSYAIKTGRDNFSLEEAETIAKLPSLIAELKRMYEWKDELIAEVKDLITYDQEDEMWVYDESKSSNPGLDAMDFIIDLATTND
ncbi:hypothetical protein N9E35_01430 [Candidatus Marinimicrobia bacterium]|nr:hypothetical protein [Candidatus Neomarinimicrobiota bacterium]